MRVDFSEGQRVRVVLFYFKGEPFYDSGTIIKDSKEDKILFDNHTDRYYGLTRVLPVYKYNEIYPLS